MEDLDRAGGVAAVMKELAKKDLLDLGVMTVTGNALGETVNAAENRDPAIIQMCIRDRPCGGTRFAHKNHRLKSIRSFAQSRVVSCLLLNCFVLDANEASIAP